MGEPTYTVDEALEAIDEASGSTILAEDHARATADAFGVELGESPRSLQPISQMDRLQPDNDNLGIGIGSLTFQIAEKLGLDPEKGDATGHGRYQREMKQKNLPKLREWAEEQAEA